MSKSSSKGSKKKTVKGPVQLRSAESPESEVFAKNMGRFLTGLRDWARSLNVLSRQRFNPEQVADTLVVFFDLYDTMTRTFRAAARVPEAQRSPVIQETFENAANVLTLFQGPLLYGCIEAVEPAKVLEEFLSTLQKVPDTPTNPTTSGEDNGESNDAVS